MYGSLVFLNKYKQHIELTLSYIYDNINIEKHQRVRYTYIYSTLYLRNNHQVLEYLVLCWA